MENTARKRRARKPRRSMRLQRIVKYMGTEPGPAREVFSLCVPRDVVRSLGLEAGAPYKFHRLGGVLAFVPVGGS